MDLRDAPSVFRVADDAFEGKAAAMQTAKKPSSFNPFLPIVLMARAGAAVGMLQPILSYFMRQRLVSSKSDVLERYQPTEHDVFVATFAKSGTNWAMQMCQQIAHRGAADFEHIHDVVSWPEASMPGIIAFDNLGPLHASPTARRVIKTHLPIPPVPYAPEAHYVALIRDPKEVVVSSYHFLLGMWGVRDKVTPAEWVKLWTTPNLIGTAWALHTACYWDLRDRPNVVVRTYGQAKADLPGTIDAIAACMHVELTAEERAKVIERSSLAYMKANSAKFDPPEPPLVKADQRPIMVRRGETGKSDELINAREQAQIDAFCREQLIRVGSDFPYDELFGGSNKHSK